MTAQKSILQNAYETTLALAIGADATETAVQVNAAPVGTPSASNPMFLVIDPDSDSTREYIKVTNRSGVSLTVVRNIDSDSGGLNAHAVGAKVRMVAMKQHFDDLNDRVSTIMNDDGTAVNTSGLVKDEDNMASDSATHLATQQSIKAYVDATIDSTEEVQDVVGGMVTGNTETFIDVTYEDGDGTLDFVVPVKDEDNFTSNSDTHLATQQSIKAYVDANSGGGGVTRNYINNPEFGVHQRSNTINATTLGTQNDDGSYTLDQWVLLSDGDDIVDIAQTQTEVPSGSKTAIELLVPSDASTTNKKFGIVQFLENVNCESIIGQEVTLSAQIKATSDL